MDTVNQKSMMSKTHFPSTSSKADGIYRVSKNIKLKDEELPFTNINNRTKNPTFD